MTTSAGLVTRARELATAAPPGSLERRAYSCAAVALSTTRTVPAARKVLADWTGPSGVQAAALAVLDDLTREAP